MAAWQVRMAKHVRNGWRFDMWYVMQVVSSTENNTVTLLEELIPSYIMERCFVPVRKMKKKFQGKWQEVTERLFPGYIFLISEHPQILYEELKNIPALTKMLGSCEQKVTPLSEGDIQLLKKLQNWSDDKTLPEVEISQIHVAEGNQVQIISGPLANMEGQIKKINLHKRIAVVEVEFMGNRSLLHLGIEMVKKTE